MSNPTPKKAPEVIEAVVVNDSNPATEATAEVVKAPSKVKNAFRHPIQTVKKHSVAAAALAGGTVVAIAALALNARNATTEQCGEITDEPADDNIVDFPIAD